VATGTWTPTGALTTPRSGHTSTLLPNGRVLVAGGYDGTNLLSSAELYDPASQTWTTTGPTLGTGVTATLLTDGRVLVADGGTTELYDPSSGTWALASAMNFDRSGHTLTLLADGRVLAAGGGPWGLLTPIAELYNPRSPQPTLLANTRIWANGSFRFTFTNTPGAAFTVLATAFPTLPLTEWMVLGGATEPSPGQFEFTDPLATNYPHRFYRLRSP
jgi:hypothetical protein